MSIRATQLALLTSTALRGTLNHTQFARLVVASLNAGTQVTQFARQASVPIASPKKQTSFLRLVSAPIANPKKVTQHIAFALVSINQTLEFNLLESGELFGPISNITVEFTGEIPEHNPYRPRIPEQLISHGEDFYDFFEENQQILREQHNITQAGDSTFPWQLTFKSHDRQLYKLGSIGRFYHEQYGVLLARYCQFDLMESVNVAHCPVGLFKTATNLEWIVTNRFELSDPFLVVGLNAAFQLPEDKTYGWVIIDGPNLQSVENSSATAKIGESFVWDAAGSVSNAAEGRVIGRRVNASGESTSIGAGQIWVKLESFSPQSIVGLVGDAIADLQESLAQLQNQLGDLPAANELVSLQTTITSVQTSLNLEIAARKAGDIQIQNQVSALDFVTLSQLNAAVTSLTNEIEATKSAVETDLAATTLIAKNALALAQSLTGFDYAALQSQMASILIDIATERERPKGKFPVVDGAIPPNLMYLDDGSLVYTETF